MPTEVVKTIRASGGDYSTLSGFLSGEGRDLTATDEIAVAEVYNDWATGLGDRFFGSGFTTDHTRYVIVRPAAGSGTNGPNKHNGIPESGFSVHYGGYSPCFYPYFDLVVEDIEIQGTGDQQAVSHYANNLMLQVQRCIVQKSGTSGRIATLRNSGSIAYYRDCLFIQTLDDQGVYIGSAGTASYVENCTLVCTAASPASASALKGDSYGNKVNARNCAFIGWFADYPDTNAFNGTGNATDKSSSTSGLPASAVAVYDLTTAAFTDAANSDYSLVAGSPLIDAGTDLSALYTDDILGATRDANFDIGAFEYVSSGGGTTTAISADRLLTIDWRQFTNFDRAAPIDTRTSRRSDRVAPVDYATTAAGQRSAPVDWGAVLQADRPLPTDSARAMHSDAAMPAGWLLALNADRSIPVDWSGTAVTTINADRVLPIDWRTARAADAAMPIDWAGTTLTAVDADRILPVDWSARIDADAAVPVSARTALRIDAALAVAHGQGLRIDAGTSIDWATLLGADAGANGVGRFNASRCRRADPHRLGRRRRRPGGRRADLACPRSPHSFHNRRSSRGLDPAPALTPRREPSECASI